MGKLHLIEFQGFIRALVMAVVLGSIIALIIHWSSLNESLVNPLADLTMLISIFAGGAWTAARQGNRGLIRGSSVGLIFFLFVLIMTIIVKHSIGSMTSLFKEFLFSMLAGGLGGVLGVAISD